MKHITKLFLLAILVVFASCQNETLSEGASSIAEDELAMEDQILVSDGEEDETFVLNNDLEAEMPAQELSFSLSSDSKSHGSASSEGDLEALELSLPESVSLSTTENPADNAYFTFEILDTDLAATGLEGWCGDVDGYLEVEGPYTFNVYSSYEDFPTEGNFENPQNMPAVNWLMNQDYIGKVSPISGETYTYGMVQWAIWQLLDDNNCRACFYLTGDDKDGWRSNSDALEPIAMEMVDAALENGLDFVPGYGEQVALLFIAPDRNPSNQIIQSVIQMVDVPAKVEPCSDCDGKVTELALEFDWRCAKKVDLVQRYENTCYGKRIYCNRYTQPGEIINVSGANHDGTFGKYIYIYINNCYYTKIKTDCDVNIGPGYIRGVFNVISGESSNGGELCEYVKTYNDGCRRYW
ncbi:hypothetical protein [Algibacter sp. R77976]|uniref:hypothetical protein n=1 Tax=Algibacter sp. R77976 TaxID=3093873 RepID=UPI0037CBAB9E